MAQNVYQPDATAGKDTYLHSSSATTNFGTADPLNLGQVFGLTFRMIIEFDISDITAGSTITATSLALDVQSAANGGGAAASHAYRLLRSDWVETEATWNIYKTSNNWTTAGAGSDGNDYTSTNGVAFNLLTSAGTLTITGLETLAQDALDNRSGKLILLLRKDVTSDSLSNAISASDNATASKRPKLTVDYTAPATSIKTVNGLAKASVKTVNGLAIASVKTYNGLS